MGDAVNGPTLFCREAFIDAVVRARIASYRKVELAGDVFAVAEVDRWRRRRFLLSPLGLYSSPRHSRTSHVLAAMRRLTTTSYRWVVRFDHDELARELANAGHLVAESHTHVLEIDRPYDELFASFSETRRRQVRKARREGVSVRRATTEADIRAYYRIHRELADSKRRPIDYPVELFIELAKLEETHILVAERDSVVIGGVVFFVDGNSFFYWHGASRRTQPDVFPTCALFDYAIRQAIERRLATVNLGASIGVSSLEEFKASWGGAPRKYWKFEWKNPIWAAMKRASAHSQRLLDAVRRRSNDAR